MIKLLWIIFLLIDNIIFNKFNFSEFFNYWDEIIVILIIIYQTIKLRDKPIPKEYFKNYIIILIILFIGLIGNHIFKYAFSYSAILRDIINFIKFPLCITLLLNNEFYFGSHNKLVYRDVYRKLSKFIRIYIIIIFLCGIVSLYFNIGMSQNEIRSGISPYMFIYSHPTYLVIHCIFLLAILECEKNVKSIHLYRMLILFIIFLTMRTKGMVFIALYILMVYFGKYLRKTKILSILFGSLLSIAVSYSKIRLYQSYLSSPREVLYSGSLKLLSHCFPFGSGFGTFASHISGKYFSKAYNFINIPSFYLENKEYIIALGDAGYPYYIAQFGFFGTILFFILFYRIYIMLTEKLTNKTPIQILMIYILISLTAESTLLNCGIEIVFILYFIYLFVMIKESD